MQIFKCYFTVVTYEVSEKSYSMNIDKIWLLATCNCTNITISERYYCLMTYNLYKHDELMISEETWCVHGLVTCQHTTVYNRNQFKWCRDLKSLLYKKLTT